MLELGVNIDHVATLRQVRKSRYPDVVAAAADCEAAGANGITVHLREDRRHIQDDDVRALRASIRTRLNLEMSVSPEIAAIALDVKPDEVCIVPERRQELTTEGGLDVVQLASRVRELVDMLQPRGIAVSLFIAPDLPQVEAAAASGARYIELHTGAFCDAEGDAARSEHGRLVAAAIRARELGLRVNAGHGINLANIREILRIPHLHTLNIGHSIVARSVFVGLKCATAEMMAEMAAYDGRR